MSKSYKTGQKLLLSLLLAMGLWMSKATAQLITLGTGTTASANTEASPISGYYNYIRYQTVYTKAEINAAGITSAGNITSLAYFVTAVPAGGVPNWEIRMANTTATDCLTHNAATVTNVYTSALPTFTANAWNTKVLTTPFYWDGTSNLLVDVDLGSAPFTSPYGSLYTYAATNGSRFIRCDGCGSQANSVTGTSAGTKPQVQLNFSAVSACSGAPAPGNTLSSSPAACSGVPFTLSLQNNPAVTGLTYQWQSSPNGTAWTDIGGATASTYSASQTVATYYRANVSCGANTTASTSLQVTMNPFTSCYCVPGTSSCTLSDVITNVTLGTLNNTSACSANGYVDYYNTVAAVTLGTGVTYPMSVTVGPGGTEYVGVWIDYNQNGVFDASEFTALGSANGATVNGSITIPGGALAGNTKMRVRVRFNTANVGTDACTTYAYGETEDYKVTISLCTAGAITVQPANVSTTCTGNASFSITATGTAITYKWQESTNGTTYNDITNGGIYSNATTNTLTLTNIPASYNTYKYRAVITGTCTAATNSNPATLTVSAPPAPTVFPASPVSACLGTPQPISITTAAGFGAPVTVSFPSGPLSLAIPENVAGINHTINVSGIPTGAVITAASVTLNITHTYVGDCMISLKAPNTNILNLDNLLSGTNNPGANFTNTVIGSTGVTLLSAGIAPGFTGLFKPDGNTAATGAFGVPSGATGYAPNTPTYAGLYSIPNGPWTIAIYDAGPPDVGTLTSWTLNLTYTPIVPYTGTWTPNAGLFTDPAGLVPYTGTSVSTVYAKPPASTTYSVTIGTGSCASPTTTVAVTVNTPVAITAQPVSTAVCTDKTTSFSVTATGTSPGHNWQVSTNGGTTYSNLANNANYAGVNTATLTITAPPVSWNGFRYRDSIGGSSPCGSAVSTAAVLTVNPLPTITVTAAPYTRLYPGLKTTLTATVSPVAASTYTWFLNGTQIPGATTGTYIADIDHLGDYTLKVTDVNGCTSTSGIKTIADSVNTTLFVYPNPNSGIFQVRYYSLPGNALVRNIFIYDDKGSRIYSQGFAIGKPYGSMNVDLSRYRSGTYWVELADGNGKRLKFAKVVVL
ncbi:MAG: GEVED domain-containing protein [Ferruginibacter sp.]